MGVCVTAAVAVPSKIFLAIKDDPVIKDCACKISTYPKFLAGEDIVRIDWNFVNHWYDSGRALFAKIRKLAKDTEYAMAYVDETGHAYCRTVGKTMNGFFVIRPSIDCDAWAATRVDGFAPSVE